MVYRVISLAALLCVLSPAMWGQAAFSVTGVVLDQDEAALLKARVTIRGATGERRQTVVTDDRGAFRFDKVAPGEYEIRVEREGFKTATTPVTIGSQSPAPLRIMLPIADLQQDVTVSGNAARVDADAGNNQDVVSLDQQLLNDLPSFDRDVVAMASRFLDAGAIGTGGVTLIVDGVEVTKVGVTASGIQEVRINNNPYSAEYSRQGRGRIEVITKPGAAELHGEFNWTFRDARLNARNPFALTRPPEQRRAYEGNLTGPIGKSKKHPTTFFFTAERDEQDLQAVILARTLDGELRLNSPTPARDVEFSVRVARQMSDKTTASILYSYEDTSSGNQGIGGFNLPEVASNSKFHEDLLRLNFNSVLSSRLVHQVNLLLGRYRAPTTSLNNAPRLVVQDAFIGGGAQADFLRTEEHWTWNEVLAYSRGRHYIKAGVQIPDFSRRGVDDRTNQLGTFFFASLDDYRQQRPYNFVQQQGRTDLHFWEVVAGAFVMDDFRLRPELSLSVGLRYDWQNYFSDHNNLAPRFGFAYAPGKGRKTVLRGGAGIFYDRTGPQPISDLLRFDGTRLQRFVVANPGFPDPYAGGGPAPASQPGSVVRLAPGTIIPFTLQFGVGVERQLQKSLTLAVNYVGARGVDLFRSRDINAPPPPAFGARPDPRFTVIRQIESNARLTSHSLEIALRGNVTPFFNGLVQYAYGRARNDTGGVAGFPANSYDLRSEWSRSDFDTRHRFLLTGTLKARKYFKLGLALSLNTGAPYSLITGRDENGDSFALDRPAGVGRNSLQGPGFAQFDLRWSREIALSRAKKDDGPKLSVKVDAFNLFNRVNFAGFVGNLSSPFFGQPVAARPPRRMQVSLGIAF